jgi:hypothetical protein
MRYSRIMKRTTVMLPEELDARVRFEARRRGVAVAEIVREAVEQHLPNPTAEGRAPLSFFAIGEGGPVDASERVDEYVVKAISKTTRRR